VTLKDAKSYSLIGKPLRRLETPARSDGSLQFGIDVRVPGMKVATVRSCPTFGGRVRSVNADRARSMHGVRDVVQLDDSVAVVADNFWTAKCAVDALEIEWDAGPHAGLTTAEVFSALASASRSGKAIVARKVGDLRSNGIRTIEAVYELPMLAHATMEPMNTTVAVRADSCEIWVGTQVPTRVVDAAARITGLPKERITVHNQYMGGGFGRRLETDSVEPAVAISKKVGYPVQLIWTREQDIRHDYYRPPYYDRVSASVNKDGLPVTWVYRDTSPSVTSRWSPGDMGKDGLDPDCVDGAVEPPYDLPNLRVEWVRHDLPVPFFGWWRGVGQTHNLFVVEGFIDELAHAAGQDPVAYRRVLLQKNARALAVLNLAAEKFGWDQSKPPARVGRGVALAVPFGTFMCVMVEIEVTAQGEIMLRRAVAAVDCGVVVNPNALTAQVEGGLLFGWTAALYGEITLNGGAVEQGNFNDYRMLRLSQSPPVEVYTVASSESPTGIGEPPTSMAAPCLVNAVFAATGVRLRRLPIDRSALATGDAALKSAAS
jgi:isoquinoline 1-oxidoreductase subunit beta